MAFELTDPAQAKGSWQPQEKKRGRPTEYSSPAEARAEAERRARRKAQSRGLVQRSVWLPMEAWNALRTLRDAVETSDAQTLSRVIMEAATRKPAQ